MSEGATGVTVARGNPMSGSVAAAPLTFLFTDVEGSTRLWEALPKAMPEALAEHFRILGEAIEGGGGALVKETGDGVFAVLSAPHAAVSAAVAAHVGLNAAHWASRERFEPESASTPGTTSKSTTITTARTSTAAPG
jgi:class 3 adenylate cyclase